MSSSTSGFCFLKETSISQLRRINLLPVAFIPFDKRKPRIDVVYCGNIGIYLV